MRNLNASQLVSRFPICFVIGPLNLAALYRFGHFLGDEFPDSVLKSGAAAAPSPGPAPRCHRPAVHDRHHNCCCESREQQSFNFTNDPASPWLTYHIFSASFLTLIISPSLLVSCPATYICVTVSLSKLQSFPFRLLSL